MKYYRLYQPQEKYYLVDHSTKSISSNQPHEFTEYSEAKKLQALFKEETGKDSEIHEFSQEGNFVAIVKCL